MINDLFPNKKTKNLIISELLIAGTVLIGCAASSHSSNSLSGGLFRVEPASSPRADSSFQNVNSSSTLFLAEQENNEFPEAGPLSLVMLMNLARQYNPTLTQAWAHVEAERAKALQAGLYPNPVIGYSGDQIGQKGTSGEFQGGFIRQEIVTAGKLELSRQKYLARASAAEFQSLAQEYRVMNGLVIQFYRLLGFQERVQIQQELLKSWQDHLLTTQEMFNVGQANEADIHQAKVLFQQQQLNVQRVENELQLEKERLITVVGTPIPSEPISGNLMEDLPSLEFEAALQRLIQESPELGLARANMKSDQIMVKRERVEPIPNINVQLASGRNNVSDETVFGAQVFIEIPVFDRNQGTIQQAQADLNRQKAEVRLTELRLRRSLAEQFQQYLTALQHVNSYREVILPESKQRYKTQLQSYQADRETWPAVLASQRDFFMRRMEYVDQLIAWRTGRVAIEGLLLTDGLQGPQNVTPPGHIDAIPKPR